MSFPADTELLREGDPVERLGIVESGRVALRLLVPGEGMVTTETVEVGDVFGLSALVPPHRSTATVTTVGQVDALFDAATLRSAFDHDCEFAASVYFSVAQSLLGRLDATHETMLDLFAGPPRAAR
ncbi:MAG: cyclic nucleotide-binding domain-containing protein [Candidatus Limnocylindria bacterium]